MAIKSTISAHLLGLGALLALGACNHYSNDLASLESRLQETPQLEQAGLDGAQPQDIAPASGGGAWGVTATNRQSLNRALAREYFVLAKQENDVVYDYRTAKAYTEKSKALLDGQPVEPMVIEGAELSPEIVAELNAARAALMGVLANGELGGSEHIVAKAQANFDCWARRANETGPADIGMICKDNYETAMLQLVTPAAGAGITAFPDENELRMAAADVAQAGDVKMMEITFAPQQDDVNEDASMMIGQAASFLRSGNGAGYTAVVTGFVSGPAATEAEHTLATNRALKVREILIGHGIAQGIIQPQVADAGQASPALMIPAAAGAQAPAPQAAQTDKVQIHLVAPGQ